MNLVMTVEAGDLRTAQVTETRRRIARAVMEVLARDGAAHLSFPAVAEQAGVSLRTVYRHFPNKERLLSAGITAGSEEATAAFPAGERDLADLHDFLPLLWQELYRNREVLLTQHTTAAGRALRGERLRARVAEARASLERTHPRLTADQRERVALMITVLMSSTVLFDLVDHLGLDTDEAAALVASALDVLATNPGGVR